jgi:putative salt-induced outer membrane protein YdiY
MMARTFATWLTVTGAVAASLGAQEKKPVGFTGDIGFVNTSGNTHLTTLSVGDKLTFQAGKVLLTQTFALVYGKTEGVQNANSQLARGRGDYAFASHLAAYGFVGYERNRFAGIDHRTDEGIGLALAAWKSDANQLDLEAGVGLVQQHLLPDPQVDVTVTDNFAAGRAAAKYKHSFTKATYFQQTLEFLPNLETTSDYRFNSESALVAPISTHFGLKASYLIKYNHRPPSAALAKSDRMLTTGVQISY